MGIRYGEQGLPGSRVFDFEVFNGTAPTRLYSLLKYSQFTLLVFGECLEDLNPPDFVKIIQIHSIKSKEGYWSENAPYRNQALLVRPDAYIESHKSLDEIRTFLYLPQFQNSYAKVEHE